MKYIKTFLESKEPDYKFEKVAKTMLKPSFGAKKGTTDFYQIISILRLNRIPTINLKFKGRRVSQF